jgi:transposase-like protein
MNTPSDLANKLGITPQQFRRWLRKHTGTRVGKGNRWYFNAKYSKELLADYRKAKGPR